MSGMTTMGVGSSNSGGGGTSIPATALRDQDGNVIRDSNGNIITAQG